MLWVSCDWVSSAHKLRVRGQPCPRHVAMQCLAFPAPCRAISRGMPSDLSRQPCDTRDQLTRSSQGRACKTPSCGMHALQPASVSGGMGEEKTAGTYCMHGLRVIPYAETHVPPQAFDGKSVHRPPWAWCGSRCRQSSGEQLRYGTVDISIRPCSENQHHWDESKGDRRLLTSRSPLSIAFSARIDRQNLGAGCIRDQRTRNVEKRLLPASRTKVMLSPGRRRTMAPEPRL